MPELNEFCQPLGAIVPNWKPALLPARSGQLVGEHCVVEPFNVEKHAQDLFDALWINNQGEAWTYLSYGPFKTCQEFIEWVASIASESSVHVVLDKANLKPIGTASYQRISLEDGNVEVGHVMFSNQLKRSTAATEAMYLMMKNAFEVLGYRRYEWKCNSMNEASGKAALRYGFTFEGTFRNAHVHKGRNRDTNWYSVIDSEWPARKARFEKWLSPDNFDANGVQLVSLNSIA